MKLKNHPDLMIHDPIKNLTDEKFIGQTIMECLLNNDPEGVMEIIQIYVDALEKTQLIETSDIPKSTLYHSLRSKNPTIKTVAKIMHAAAMIHSDKNTLKK